MKILKKQNKTKVQAVNRKNPPIIYYKPNKINVQSLDSRVFINVQKYCKEKIFFKIKTNTGLTIFYITMFRVKKQQQQQNYVLMCLLNIVTSITSK